MAKDSVKVEMKPSHPGGVVREEVLVPLNLNITEAAEVLGVRRATLSDLVNEKTSLSPEMALRLEKAFGVSMDMMLRAQAWFDCASMREREGEFNIRRYQP